MALGARGTAYMLVSFFGEGQGLEEHRHGLLVPLCAATFLCACCRALVFVEVLGECLSFQLRSLSIEHV